MKSPLVKVIVFAVLAVALFACLAVLKYRFEHQVCPAGLGLKGLARGGGTEVLFMGSSLTRMGCAPAGFENITGKRAYVLAYNGLDPTFYVPLLKHVMSQPALRPQVAVIEISVVTASAPPALRDTNLFCHMPPAVKGEYLDLLRSLPGGFSWRQWYELVVSAKSSDIVFHPLVDPALDTTFYHGAHVNAPVSHLTREQFEKTKPLPTDTEPLNPRQLQGLAEVIKLLKDSGIKTVFVSPPIPRPIFSQPTVPEKQAALQKLVEDAGFAYFDGMRDFPVDDPAAFFDGRHLSAQGRELYTRRLAAFLSPYLIK